MEVLCNQCQLTIQIHDERVPLLTTFRVICPRCKRKIVIPSIAGMEEATIPYTPSQADFPSKAPNLEGMACEEFSYKTVDALNIGHQTCLMCLDQEKNHVSLKYFLEEIGYTIDCAKSQEHALQQLRMNQYDIIILDDQFGGISPNPIANYLSKLNMNIRRDTFVILIGEKFETANHWEAFVESVNLVCNTIDIGHIPVIAKQYFREYERFYKVFNECLISSGKKI